MTPNDQRPDIPYSRRLAADSAQARLDPLNSQPLVPQIRVARRATRSFTAGSLSRRTGVWIITTHPKPDAAAKSHRASRTAGALPTAISCLGAFRTPAASACTDDRHRRRPKTCTEPDSCTAATSPIIRSPRRQGRVASAARQCRARHDCAEHCSGVRGFVVRRLYDVSEMALLSHILYDWRSPNHLILRPQMLDNPKKTEPLLVALKAAVPFEVELMPELIEHLRATNIAMLNEIRQTVSDERRHCVPYCPIGYTRSARRITDARSDASHYATCVGSHRLSEASSEEAKKAEVKVSSPNASCA